jgi:hypothetical protein
MTMSLNLLCCHRGCHCEEMLQIHHRGNMYDNGYGDKIQVTTVSNNSGSILEVTTVK